MDQSPYTRDITYVEISMNGLLSVITVMLCYRCLETTVVRPIGRPGDVDVVRPIIILCSVCEGLTNPLTEPVDRATIVTMMTSAPREANMSSYTNLVTNLDIFTALDLQELLSAGMNELPSVRVQGYRDEDGNLTWDWRMKADW